MKKICIVLLICIMSFSMFACSTNEVKPDNKVEDEQVNKVEDTKEAVKIASLKGPTSMGLVKLMSDEEEKKNSSYDFNIVTMADEIVTGISTGKIDIAALPANLASVLYNKTEGKIKVAAVNTLGVLYIVENGETISNFEDLKGKTIITTGKGQAPELVLNYLLKQNGLVPNKDVTIEFKSEPTEVASILASEENVVALLPEPFITSAKMSNNRIRTVFDMTKEWSKLQGEDASSLVTGVLVVREEFLKDNKEAFDEFLAKYEESIAFTNENVDEAAVLIDKYGIIKEDIAKVAIPKCNISYVDGSELVQSLGGYLEVLYEANPQSIGGKLPDEEFYYAKE